MDGDKDSDVTRLLAPSPSFSNASGRSSPTHGARSPVFPESPLSSQSAIDYTPSQRRSATTDSKSRNLEIGHGPRRNQHAPGDHYSYSATLQGLTSRSSWFAKAKGLHYDSEAANTGKELPLEPLAELGLPHVFRTEASESPGTRNPNFEGKRLHYSDRGVGDHVQYSRWHWASVSILILAVYSTAMSGLWLVAATYRPIWGYRISTHHGVTPSNASLACALLAKSIELSFVTVFVAFLGQRLSRTAFYKPHQGMSLADMSVRTWVQQPGSMITDWKTVRYAAPSWLGLMAICVTCLAMLYTSASDALISPKLLLGSVEHRVLYGNVSTFYANLPFIENRCNTPISPALDPNSSGLTCGAIQQAGQGFHNLAQYLNAWENATAPEGTSSELADRPRVPAMLYDNTTVKGSWINAQKFPGISEKGGRIINNVTLAFPHSGVVAASQIGRNQIMQPSDLGGQGQYHINASVPSPTLNVLCASMTKIELMPIIYRMWPFTNSSLLSSVNWVDDVPLYPDWLNNTSVDDIFGFGERYQRRPPIFPRLPGPFNILLNHTGGAAAFADSIYLLAATENSLYTMCSLRASMTAKCSTSYHAATSGAHLESNCHNSADAYGLSNHGAPEGSLQPNWSRVAEQWAFSTSLNSGFSDDDASITRLLTQLIPTEPSLNRTMPSIAEALAALAGSTLLLSSLDSPFVPYWNYTTSNLTQPVQQGFNATIRTYQYQSSYVQPWQQAFFVILSGTFVVSCFCLGYFVRHGGWMMDLTEPLNTFTLALNSSPRLSLGKTSTALGKHQYQKKWSLRVDHTSGGHFESATKQAEAQMR